MWWRWIEWQFDTMEPGRRWNQVNDITCQWVTLAQGGTVLKIKQTAVKFGFTKNLGNFESMRVDVEFSADLGDSDDARQVVADLEKLAKAEVRRIITGKIEKQDDLEDFY